MAGHGGGGSASIRTVEIVPGVLPSSPSNAAKEALDFLYDFAEHCLAEEDVDPGVQDGVH